jgi:hypothetical protein
MPHVGAVAAGVPAQCLDHIGLAADADFEFDRSASRCGFRKNQNLGQPPAAGGASRTIVSANSSFHHSQTSSLLRSTMP